MKDIVISSTYCVEDIVTENKLAKNVGSGIVNVYATPMMIALMEQAATKCLDAFLDEGETSVGILMNSTHDAATPCGMKVKAEATIIAVNKKKVSFEIVASDACGIIGKATHNRFIVNKDRFESKALSKLNA